MTLFFIIKLLIVAYFLVMFLRGSRVVWGTGLLTVSSALLLDTVLGTFGHEEIQARLGFFFYVLAGALFGGAAIWLWGLLRSRLELAPATVATLELASSLPPPPAEIGTSATDGAFDRTALFEDMRSRLSPEDIRDLIFDLEWNENDILAPYQPMAETLRRVMSIAEQEGKQDALALAVERILTPVPPSRLPRREKLSTSSPPTILRHFLLAHYTLKELAQMASALDVDWEQLGGGGKKEMVRNFLLHLKRRDRLGELIQQLKQPDLSIEPES